MDNGDRATPVALTRNPPVAQTVGGCALAALEFLEALARRPFRVGNREAIEKGGVEQSPVLDIGGVADRECRGVLIWWQYDRDHRELVFAGEFEIALIVGGTAEDRAGAVFHQHKVGDVDRNLAGLVEWVNRLQACRVAAFRGSLDYRFAGAHTVAFGDEVGEARVFLGKAQSQRMVRRNRQERGAEQRVLPSCEHLDALVLPGDLEEDAGALRPADPVLLHEPDAFRPTVETGERI